jgi:hypothetical protein
MSHKANDNYYEQQKELEEDQKEAIKQGEFTEEERDRDEMKMKTEEFYKVFGRKVTKSERDKMTMEKLLIDISNNIHEYYRRGGDPKILHDTLINSMAYLQLSEFISAGDAFLRVAPKY